MSITSLDTGPIPLHLPAILQNPENRAARQVEAHNAQQREKVAARRAAAGGSEGAKGTGRGKRVVRRMDNATFTHNPHITLPTRRDFYPPVPLQPRKTTPSFPANTVPRSEYLPSITRETVDPYSQSSVQGNFSTSLKGTRAMLRKRGRRAEGLIGVVEKELRGWLGDPLGIHRLGGSGDDEGGCKAWKVIDPFLVDIQSSTTDHTSSSEEATNIRANHGNISRRLPNNDTQGEDIPDLPIQKGQIPAVLELSRSPAHLSWCITESFERLVIHLLARYYNLVSWSEDKLLPNGTTLRLTHIIQPTFLRPKLSTTQALATPETTDISDLSDLSDHSSAAGSSSERESDHISPGQEIESDSDTETERGTEIGQEDDIGYSLDPPSLDNGDGDNEELNGDITIKGIEDLDLQRIPSHGSSMYASSEAGSGSEWSDLGDSLTLPPSSTSGVLRTGEVTGTGGWTSMIPKHLESSGHLEDVPISRRIPALGVDRSQRNWEDKPSFFEYLYGS